jgi:hypothetical protein
VNRLASVALFGLFLGFASFSFAEEPVPLPDRVWAIQKPLQCLSNPWETDWLKRHKKKKAHQYPIREERAVIKAFLEREGIKVWEVRVSPFQGGGTCASCDCPRGDTLFVLVDASDAPKMDAFGFKKRMAYDGSR